MERPEGISDSTWKSFKREISEIGAQNKAPATKLTVEGSSENEASSQEHMEIGKRALHPVDLTKIDCGPMQHGEPSWASWHCGGGPHTQDRESVHPAVRPYSP